MSGIKMWRTWSRHIDNEGKLTDGTYMYFWTHVDALDDLQHDKSNAECAEARLEEVFVDRESIRSERGYEINEIILKLDNSRALDFTVLETWKVTTQKLEGLRERLFRKNQA